MEKRANAKSDGKSSNANRLDIKLLQLCLFNWHSPCIFGRMNALARQNIGIFARYLYQIEGCPKGRAKEHWLNAEKQLNENLFRDDRSTSVAKADFRQK